MRERTAGKRPKNATERSYRRLGFVLPTLQMGGKGMKMA